MKSNNSVVTDKLSEEQRKKEAVINVFGEESSYNAFYDSVSVAFRIASFLIIAVFLFFIISSAFTNADEFSYENLEYIVRNFALTLDENKDDTVYSVQYNPDSSRTYSLFGNGLAVSGNSGVSIYSATGRLTCSENFNYKDPVMIASGKYALVYDNNGVDYSVYNKFTEVYSSQMAYPIKGAAIADNGCFALISSSDGFQSTVEVYNDSFSIINRFNKTGYVIDVDINDTSILIATVEADEQINGYTTELLHCNLGESEANSIARISGHFPLSCAMTEDGYVAVCNDAVVYFDGSGNELSTYVFCKGELLKFDADSDKVLLLFKKPGFNVSYSVVCVNSDGKELYSYDFSSTVFDIDLFDGVSFVLTESSVILLTEQQMRRSDFTGADHNCKLLAYSQTAVYVCTDRSAPLIRFDK